MERETVGEICLRRADLRYVVCLASRQGYMASVLAQWNLEARIFPAVGKADLNLEALRREGFISEDCDCTPGEIACFRSHWKIWNEFLASTAENCLILEDDLCPPSDGESGVLAFRLQSAWTRLPPDYDLFYLGRGNDNRCLARRLGAHLVSTRHSGCTHAYLISRSGAEKLLCLPPMRNLAVDQMIQRSCRIRAINAYAVTPPVFFQNRAEQSSTLGRKNRFWGIAGSNRPLSEYTAYSRILYYGAYLIAFIAMASLVAILLLP